MKNQALFSSKARRKKSKCPLLQFLFGALRVKHVKGSLHFQHALTSLEITGIIQF